jgi:flagellar hook protein FlgE
MSLQGALFTGVSGLTTYSDVINIIGHNIANVNTPGFKESRGNFSDILSQSSGPFGNVAIGRGVRMNSVDTLFAQGSFQSTSVGSDLAIDGDGFFIVRDPATNALLYTRTGDFRLNRDGSLANSQGMLLQGFDIDANGNALPFVGEINIAGQAIQPTITTSAEINLNLDSSDQVIIDPGTGLPVVFDPTDPVGTSNFSTALNVFDSLGNAHTIEIYVQKTGNNAWHWLMTARANDLNGMAGNTLVPLAEGDMTFTDAGSLDTLVTTDRIDYAAVPPIMTPLAAAEQGVNVIFDFAGGVQLGQAVTFDFGIPQQIFDSTTGTFSPNPNAPTTFDGTTQFSAVSSTLFQSQDGFGSGTLNSFSVDNQGIVRGLFSNGQTLDLMRVALAKFPSNSGLNLIGENLFSQSLRSGDPVVSSPGTSGLGDIVPSALEVSNVDLSSQFVELIRTQQAFQANARVITTGDELLTETVNLRR